MATSEAAATASSDSPTLGPRSAPGGPRGVANLRYLTTCLPFALCALLAACGGGGTAGGPDAGGSSLQLVSFLQDGLDNVALNTRLEFHFSAALDAGSVTDATVQIRGGNALGHAAHGTFEIDGATLRFVPDLAGLCDLSDGGLRPDTSYTVTLAGSPVDPPLRDVGGRALSETITLDFHTLDEADPALFEEPTPGAGPLEVTQATPANGSEAVTVADGNRIVLTINANLRPCSVSAGSVRLLMVQIGDIDAFVPAEGGTGNASGFATPGGDTSDQDPSDPFSWGDATALPNVTTVPIPQTIPARVRVVQSFDETQIVVTPDFGASPIPSQGRSRFPENALLVLHVTASVESYSGKRLTPFILAFTTQNLPAQENEYTLENEGETPYDADVTTADVDSARAPGRVQGFLLFAGNGDNGSNHLQPSLPQSDTACSTNYQDDDGTLDHFDPSSDVLLDTGSSPNACANDVDGSLAVVWEFKTLRVRSGVTVRIVGRNPAMILVQGDAHIEAGGRLLVRGDGLGGAPQGAGEGGKDATTSDGTEGGAGVAGGGDGGSSPEGFGTSTPARYGEHGAQGYYHDPTTGALASDVGSAGGSGGGHGNISARWNEQINPSNRNTPSGGGGGHATGGQAGTALGTGESPVSLDDTVDGAAGGTYGSAAGHMQTPEAGSGGGAGGELRPFSANIGRGPGGAGGAGGGFLDVTCGGTLTVLGTIDAAGADGGSNAGGLFNPNYAWNPGTGGGGGGSGGGIRLLTPNDIVLGASTVISAAGGRGGVGGASHGISPPLNDGGDGGAGRIVMEDANSVVTGLNAASVTPGEGTLGFYRGSFDGSRFQGGGLVPVALTEVFSVGAFDPRYEDPVQDYTGQTDFVAGTTTSTGPGIGKTCLLIEARGYQMHSDGTPDYTGLIAAPTGWRTVGYFTDSGTDAQPTWNLGQPPLAEIGGALPTDNTGAPGLTQLDTYEFIQLRITMYLSPSAGAADPGPYLDRWVIRSTSDQ